MKNLCNSPKKGRNERESMQRVEELMDNHVSQKKAEINMKDRNKIKNLRMIPEKRQK